MKKSKHGLALLLLVTSLVGVTLAQTASADPGVRVSLGTFSLHLHCSGKGAPMAVVENGLQEFAVDWMLVQQQVERSERICTYDRAGYGISDMGPTPRTFAQLNLELHELLRRAGEKPPFVLVGHSYGGPVIRNYAALYPDEVAGMVLAESIAEHQPLVFGDKAVYLKDFAKHQPIPQPSLNGPVPHVDEKPGSKQAEPLEQDYLQLPAAVQQLHQQYEAKPALGATEQSQRDWSPEYFAAWDEHPQTGLLGSKPLIVLTRAESGYDPSPNYSREQLDGQRLRSQTELLRLSSNSVQVIVPKGHELELDAPDVVAWAILATVDAARTHHQLLTPATTK